MTDLATLAVKIDSSSVPQGVQELDRLTAAGTKTEKAVEGVGAASTNAGKQIKTASQAAAELARDVQQAASAATNYDRAYSAANAAIKSLASAQAQATRETNAAKAAYKAGSIGLEEYKGKLLQTKSALSVFQQEHASAMSAMRNARAAQDGLSSSSKQANDSSKQAAAGMRNLAFQAQDLGVQLAMAAQSSAPLKGALMALVMQGPQIKDALDQTGKSAGQLVLGFARAHPVLTAFAAAAGVAAIGLKGLTIELNAEKKAELDAYANSLGLTKKEMEELGPITIGVTDVIKGFGMTVEEYIGVKASDVIKTFQGLVAGAFNAIQGYSKTVVAAVYAGWVGGFNGIKAAWSMLPAAIGDAAVTGANIAIAATEKIINNAITAVNALNRVLNPFMALAGMAGIDVGIPKISLPRIENAYSGAGAAAGKAFAGAVQDAYNEAMGAQDVFFKRVGENAAKSAKDAYRREAEKKGFLDPEPGKKAGAKAGKDAADAWIAAFKRQMEAETDAALKAMDVVAKAQIEAIKRFQEQDFEATLTDAANAQRARTQATVDAIEKQADLNDELKRTVDLLDQMGNSNLGNLGAMLAGLTSGDFSGARGPVAGLLQQLGGITWRDPADANGPGAIHVLREEIVNGLDEVFGGNGSFAKTMNTLLQGAGIGGAVGSIMGGGKTAQLGSSLGGALGSALSGTISKAVGGALGSALGAAAPFIGAIAGNLLGSLLSSTPKGRATFGGGSFTTSGNSQSLIGAASGLAGGVLDALNQIADAFGADVGSFSGTIGVRGKNIRYNPNGTSLRDGLNFGQDEEAALKAAIQDAISDGVFSGLSEGIERLLKGEGDLEKQLQKALSLQGVFDEIKSIKDPQGFELGNLDKQFAKLRAIAEEAGEGLAEVEELYGLKRKEIVEKYASQTVEDLRAKRELEIQIMELSGDAAGALAAARQLELDAMDPSLRALQERVYALQDEAVAAANAAAAEAEAVNLRIRLAEALGNEEEALALRRQQELAAVNPLNAALLQTVQAAEAAGSAVQRASQAMSAASTSLGMLSGGGGGASGMFSALQDPILGEGLRFVLGGGSLAQGAALTRSKVNDQAIAAFPNDPAAQARFVSDFEASVAAGRTQNQTPRNSTWYGSIIPTIGGKANMGGNNVNAGNALLQQQIEMRKAEADQKKAAAEEKRLAAIEREAAVLEDIIDRFKELRGALKDYHDELDGVIRGPTATFRKLQIDLIAAGASTDPEQLAKIPQLGRQFQEMALARSSTATDYAKQIAFLRGIVGQAEDTAERVKDNAEAQLDALNRQADKQDETNVNLQRIIDLLDKGVSVQSEFKDEQRQLGLAIEKHTYNSDRTLRNVSRGGTSIEAEVTF